MEKEIISGINAINKFMFYVWNFKAVDSGKRSVREDGQVCAWYVPEVIMKANWNCNTQHMLDKWIDYIKYYPTEKAFMSFYAELSNDNRVAMLDWIISNYHGVHDIVNE